jgi:hypothetical protein
VPFCPFVLLSQQVAAALLQLPSSSCPPPRSGASCCCRHCGCCGGGNCFFHPTAIMRSGCCAGLWSPYQNIWRGQASACWDRTIALSCTSTPPHFCLSCTSSPTECALCHLPSCCIWMLLLCCTLWPSPPSRDGHYCASVLHLLRLRQLTSACNSCSPPLLATALSLSWAGVCCACTSWPGTLQSSEYWDQKRFTRRRSARRSALSMRRSVSSSNCTFFSSPLPRIAGSRTRVTSA